MKTTHDNPLVAHFHVRQVGVEIIGKPQNGTGLEVEGQMTLQRDGSCQVGARRYIQRATTLSTELLNGSVDGCRIEGNTVVAAAHIEQIEGGCLKGSQANDG